jgi:endogenous inhibitor of DNA gyrase (YacG/DUF329 family)
MMMCCPKCYEKKVSGNLVELRPMEDKDAYKCPECGHEVNWVDVLDKQRGWMSK